MVAGAASLAEEGGYVALIANRLSGSEGDGEEHYDDGVRGACHRAPSRFRRS